MQTTMRMFAVPNANIFRRRKDFPLHFGKKATGLILLTATVYMLFTKLEVRIHWENVARNLDCTNRDPCSETHNIFAVRTDYVW